MTFPSVSMQVKMLKPAAKVVLALKHSVSTPLRRELLKLIHKEMNGRSESHPETDPPWQLQNAFSCFMSVCKHLHEYIPMTLGRESP